MSSGVRVSVLSCLLLTVCLLPYTAAAQTPPAVPAPSWSGSLGVGLAVTEGNRDSSSVNVSYEVRRRLDESPFVLQSKGLWLRGSTEGELTTNRLGLEARLERRLGERTSLFAQTQYLRDRFKEIDYLVAPTVGVSRLLIATDARELGVNAGLGTVWEQTRGRDVEFDGALTAAQQYTRRLSETARFTQSLSALWKVHDLADSLYTLTLGLAATLTARTQLKLELVDTFKNRQPDPSVLKNDVSIVASIVFKY